MVPRSSGGQDPTSTPGKGLLEVGTLADEKILLAIHVMRGCRVMLDADLAALYGVETKALTRAVRRNPNRFPTDFMFQLSDAEFAHLRRQSGASNQWGGRRYPPLAFTEHGVADAGLPARQLGRRALGGRGAESLGLLRSGFGVREPFR